MSDVFETYCPLPNYVGDDCLALAHGEGGRLSRELITRWIAPYFPNDHLAELGDAAVLPTLNGPPVFTTDSFVVSPLEFPGGDIGTLAVYGTANDLAVAGAVPRWISLALIVEEGFRLSQLAQILASVAQAAARAGVTVVTGDTKVVPRGAADGLFINTAGIGELVFSMPGPAALEPGDEILVTGPLAQHGMAVLVEREQLRFDPPPTSDCAPLIDVTTALRNADIPVKCMRDATRGGVAAVLHEWADACRHTLQIEAAAIPVTASVRGVCELLGLDPLHIACEGTLVAAVPPGWRHKALTALRQIEQSRNAVRLGTVLEARLAPVVVDNGFGQDVPLDEPAGAPLPRIC
jgi:hydrogenase expression/formation protein HypE